VGNVSYTFGDSTLAGMRLALLAEVFRDSTADLLGRVRTDRRRVAVDLGCGPGFTTTLLRDVFGPDRLIAVDSSAAFVREAVERLGASGEVLCADVVDLPGQVQDADLIFARFLLTHLTEPVAVINHWLDRLAASGVLVVEEVESISTDEPILARYLDLQRRMLEANGNRLEIGPVIEAAVSGREGVLHSGLAVVTPPASSAARMFAMNFAQWRTRPAVLELASIGELDEIKAGLDELSTAEAARSQITWELRQISLAGA
jgi:trans-aconitate 2-methyltransferase